MDGGTLNSPLILDDPSQKHNSFGREYVHGLCDCLSYKDRHGQNHCFPYFCPMSLFGTCCIAGRVQTLISQESDCCCGMGIEGKSSPSYLCYFLITNTRIGTNTEPSSFFLISPCHSTRLLLLSYRLSHQHGGPLRRVLLLGLSLFYT